MSGYGSCRIVARCFCRGPHWRRFDLERSDIIHTLLPIGPVAGKEKMMIQTLFVRVSFLARLLEPPLGSYLESLAQRLQAQNYSLGVIRNSGIRHIGPKTSVKLLRRVTHPRGFERRIHV